MENELPVWLNRGVEPPESLKTTGWQPGMKPSAQHMNWLFYHSYMALKELQENGGISIGDVAPTNQAQGGLWFQTGLGESDGIGGGECGISMKNAILSDGEPGDTEALWLDYDEQEKNNG